MKHKITLIPGDGIGPEVTKPTLGNHQSGGSEDRLGNSSGGSRSAKKTRLDDSQIVDGLV